MPIQERKEECIDASGYYQEYHGHRIPDLQGVLRGLRKLGKSSVIFLAGDSSLDNKHWLYTGIKAESFMDSSVDAVNSMDTLLSPARSIPDVAHWLNVECNDHKHAAWACLNTAVEESTIGERKGQRMFPQDEFIRDNITSQDVLVVSVGGNDVALKPTQMTMQHMFQLVTASDAAIEDGSAPGYEHFIRLFRDDLADWLTRLCSVNKPQRIVVCMLYYLDEQPTGSWADAVLAQLGYTQNPGRVQAIIRYIYTHAIQQITIPDVQVETVPLFSVMDGKDTRDYSQRVEPSAIGGQKMAKLIYPVARGPT